ncbi:MAG: hypothetical protein HFH39_07210 [Lachnospiraceae bacterium]|nr:hypothetical protein [Lachnospiraceae bacterium]
MDRYEFKLKVEQLEQLQQEKDFETAAEIADTINWRKVKSAATLCMVGEIYDRSRRYEDSREILLMAYDRAAIGRSILYRLTLVALKMGNIEEAKDYYEEFVDVAPHDNSKYILQYQIAKLEGASLEEQIAILEEFKERDFREEWAFELAYLYHCVGEGEKCVEACDEIVLWFGDGKYVEKALEMKILHQPLDAEQEKKYRQFQRQKRKQRMAGRRAEAETKPGSEPEPEGSPIENGLQPKPSPRHFHTSDLQAELAKGMQQIKEADTQKAVSDTMDNIRQMLKDSPYLQIPKPQKPTAEEERQFGHIETEEEIDQSLHSCFQEYLAEEWDGQYRMHVPSGVSYEPQVAGQMHVDEVLSEWEKTRRAYEAVMEHAQQRKLESAKAMAWREASQLMDSLNRMPDPEIMDSQDSNGELGGERYQDVEESEAIGFRSSNGEFGGERYQDVAESEAIGSRSSNGELGGERYQDVEESEAIGFQSFARELGGQRYQDMLDSIAGDPQNMPEGQYWQEEPFPEAYGQELEPTEGEGQLSESKSMYGQPEYSENGYGQPEYAGQGYYNRKYDYQEGQGFTDAGGAQELAAEGMGSQQPSDMREEAGELQPLNAQEEAGELHLSNVRNIVQENRAYNAQEEVEEQPQTAVQDSMGENQGYNAQEEAEEQPQVNVQDSMGENQGYNVQEEAEERPQANVQDSVGENQRYNVQCVAGVQQQAAMQEEGIGMWQQAAMQEEAGVQQVAVQEEEVGLQQADKQGGADELQEYAVQEKALQGAGQQAVGQQTPGVARNVSRMASRTFREWDIDSVRHREMPYGTPNPNAFARHGERKENSSIIPLEKLIEKQARQEPVRSKEKDAEEFLESVFRAARASREEKYSVPRMEEEPKGSGARLSEEQKKIFSYFVPVVGMEQQLCRVLDGVANRESVNGSSSNGNIIITGGKGSGKTVLATDFIRAIQKSGGHPNGKVGKITGASLNQKDLSLLLKKVAGGYLIIERAGEMSRETVARLALLMDQDTDGLLVILEDIRKEMEKVLSLDANFAKKFTEWIKIPVFTSDELVEFAKAYAAEQECEIDDMGILALYNRISSIQKLDEATTLTEVKEIVDEAISSAERGGLKKIFGRKKFSPEGYLYLRERDFDN